jgi:hypothetical protein
LGWESRDEAIKSQNARFGDMLEMLEMLEKLGEGGMQHTVPLVWVVQLFK